MATAAIIGEIGKDMSKFPRVENICLWAGLSPSCNENAGKSRSTKTRHGNLYIKSILCEYHQLKLFMLMEYMFILVDIILKNTPKIKQD